MIISFLLLFIPLIWEILNDKDGDAHLTRGILRKYAISSKKTDVIARILLAFIVSGVNKWIFDIDVWKSVFLSGAIHFFFFDYIIAYVLFKRGIISPYKGKWWIYMGSKGMDNSRIWRNIPPLTKLTMRIIILIIAIFIYF